MLINRIYHCSIVMTVKFYTIILAIVMSIFGGHLCGKTQRKGYRETYILAPTTLIQLMSLKSARARIERTMKRLSMQILYTGKYIAVLLSTYYL